MAEAKEPKFEEALAALENIVEEMESGQLSLEESMKKFEAGMKLAQLCSKKLGQTEKKVEILLKKADAAVEWKTVEQAAPDTPDSGELDLGLEGT